ncbi:hypothetical protein FACS189490_05200 [Clostridia bacterium]|nr:hypothetical protein FACS189490_05200 [Clostridia bacterium]
MDAIVIMTLLAMFENLDAMKSYRELTIIEILSTKYVGSFSSNLSYVIENIFSYNRLELSTLNFAAYFSRSRTRRI